MHRALLLLLMAVSAIPAHAQSTADAIKTRLLDQPLYLRGAWESDKLHFNPAGQLIGRSDTTSFTLAAIDIAHVDLQSNKLLIEGRRVGIVFEKDIPSRVPLNAGDLNHPREERIRIEIDAPPSRDYTAPLDAILTTSPGDMLPVLPGFWLPYVRKHFPPTLPPLPAAEDSSVPELPHPTPARPAPANRIGGGVTPPRVVYLPEPEFDEAARKLKLSGNSLVSLVVDADGSTARLAIVRPTGLGLDEKAIEAVQRYRFQPATRNGQPIAVELNVDVNFQIF